MTQTEQTRETVYPHYRCEGSSVLCAENEDAPYMLAAKFYGEDGADKAEMFVAWLATVQAGGMQ